MSKRSRPLLVAVAAAGISIPIAVPVGHAAAATPDVFAARAAALASPRTPLVGAHEEDREDVGSAFGLCRTANVLGLTFNYAAPSAGEVDAIVNDALNVGAGGNNGCTTPQNETSIAVNPRNPNNLVAGANDYRVCCSQGGLRNDGTGWAYFSFDGGRSWGNVQVPALTLETGGVGVFATVDAAGDPALTFGRDGTAYYANIVFSRLSAASGIVVSRSSDGGKSWSAPSLVQFDNDENVFNDKEWIAADGKGRVAVTWTRFSNDAQGNPISPIVGSESRDGGATWGSFFPISDDDHPFDQFSQVAYGGDDGRDLIVSWEGASPSTGFATDATVLARRRGGAGTFPNVEVGRVFDDLDCYPIFGGRQTLTDMHFRQAALPSMSVDQDSGRITIVWADDEGAGNCGGGGTAFSGTTSNQVKLITGRVGRMSAPRRITRGAADKVFPSVATNDGRTVVSYYTRGYVSTNPACFVRIPDSGADGALIEPSARSVCLDYAATSSSGGFGRERRLTSEGSNPFIQFTDGSFIGDYSQVVLGRDGVAHAAWTDFRGRPGTDRANQDVYVNNFRTGEGED